MAAQNNYREQFPKTYGSKIGLCNICGELSELTKDHVPPKGTYNVTVVELRAIHSRLSLEHGCKYRRVLQNGTTFRTLCLRCNRDLLGARYDPELIKFAQTLKNFLSSSLSLPPVTAINGRALPIAKSVLGHLSAVGVDRFKKGPKTEEIKDFILDEARTLPDGVEIFYWPYPYRQQVIARDFSWMNFSTKNVVIAWVLKFFPISFLVVFDRPKSLNFQLSKITAHLAGSNEAAPLEIKLWPLVHELWPEAPDNESGSIFGRDSYWSKTRP